MDTKRLECLRSLTLLYVEDDLATREELAQILGLWFSRVHVADNGHTGLAAFEAMRPDIVLTDIQMPVLNGLSMSAQIRLLAPEQPVIVISAYNDMEYLFRAIDIGINQYITKPVSVERLLDKLLHIADDLAARRERRRNLRLLEQYRQLVDASAIVSKLDSQGRITYINDRFCDLSGYSRRELVGSEIRRIRHPDEPKDLSGTLWQGILEGHQWAGIIKNRTRTGEVFVVDSNIVPIFDERQQIEEIVCLDVDITDIYLNYENLVESLSRSQRSLHEQRHFLDEYKRALELGTSICVTNAEGSILGANPLFAQSLGYSVPALMNKTLDEIAPGDHDRCYQEVIENIGGYSSKVMSFLHAEGSERVFSVIFVAVRDLDGRINSIILGCQDVTSSVRATREILETQRELLLVMGELVENSHRETGRHVTRVAEIAWLLAGKSGLTEEQAEMIRTAATMHDLGKFGIPDAILHKPGKLDPAEIQIMRTHAELGHRLLHRIDRPLLQLAARIAHQHHEHFDGNGYPQGLRGEGIAIEGRIMAIADVLDALGQPRTYRPAWDDVAIRNYFRAQSGTQFDPDLVALLLDHWDEFRAIQAQYPDT